MFITLKILFSVIISLLFLYGSIRFIKDVENNNCNMTYMFMYPEYIKLPFTPEVKKRFPHYNLYVYGEGSYANSLRKGKFEGIPVIFVPGNAGSYRQVRSAGSVALQMSHSLNIRTHFNFFSIDFNEELSALYGGVLEEQTAFLHECINYVRKLYRNANTTKILLLGHSMGGIIIRGLLVSEEFDSSDIYLIITLATPHKRPVIAIDPFISMYYDKLQTEWLKKRQNELQHFSVISIAGGNRDLLVRSDLTVIPSPYNLHNDINIHEQQEF